MTAYVLPAARINVDRTIAQSTVDHMLSVAHLSYADSIESLNFGVGTPMVTQVNWTDPTHNVDGSAIVAGEITGYAVGVRLASGTAGTYAYSATAPATAVNELLSLLSPVLPTGVSLIAAVQAVSTANGNSAWSAESAAFTLPVPAPNAPTAVGVS